MFFRAAKICLFVMPFLVLVVSINTLFPFIVGKYVLFRILTGLGLIFFLLGLLFEAEAGAYMAELKRLLRSPLFWAVTAFVFFFVLAGFTGLRPTFSFWSNFERGEGGFQMLNLYVMFVLLAVLFRDRSDWKKLFWLAVIATVLMGIYGLFAGLKYIDAESVTVMRNGEAAVQYTGQGGPWFHTFRAFVGPKFDPGYRFEGSIGNPAYVAAYILFILFYLAALFLWSDAPLKGFRGVLFGLLGAFSLLLFYISGTRGGFLGFLTGLVAAAVVLGWKMESGLWRRRIFAAVLIVVLAACLLIVFRSTALVKALPGSRIFDISLNRLFQSGAEGTFGTRTIMWSIAWEAWQSRPLLGYGPENYIWTFDRFFDPRYYHPGKGFNAWFDRAHSLIFDYLAETGILGLLSFASIFAALGFLLYKFSRRLPEGKDKLAGLGLLAATAGLAVAYLVQGLVLFDVLIISLNLFIFFAFALFAFRPEPAEPPAQFRPGLAAYAAGFGGIILAASAVYVGAILPYLKANRFITAEANIANVRTLRDFEENFNYVLNFYSPVGDEEVPKFLSNDVLGVLPRVNDQAAAKELVRFIEAPLLQGYLKDDVRHQIIVAQLHIILWNSFREEAEFAKSEQAYMKAHELGPKLPQPLEGLYTIYVLHGDKDKAAAIKSQLISLWPQEASLNITTTTAAQAE